MDDDLGDEEELEAVLGQTLGAIGQDGNEWYLVFTNGARLTLSSGHLPFFKVGYPHQ